MGAESKLRQDKDHEAKTHELRKDLNRLLVDMKIIANKLDCVSPKMLHELDNEFHESVKRNFGLAEYYISRGKDWKKDSEKNYVQSYGQELCDRGVVFCKHLADNALNYVKTSSRVFGKNDYFVKMKKLSKSVVQPRNDFIEEFIRNYKIKTK